MTLAICTVLAVLAALTFAWTLWREQRRDAFPMARGRDLDRLASVCDVKRRRFESDKRLRARVTRTLRRQ